MGKKYSINSAGRIVAERDIYSLGGLIVKGSIGGSVKDETQLSQEGECWLNAGDISTRPDVVIKDNAYIGNFFTNESPVHTDGIMEFSGNTLIPGHITIRCPQADPKNNVFVKDSFIGVSMNILPGPRTTATAFPFEQGGYLSTAPRGTAFSSSAIQTQDINLCRSTDAVIRCGLNTYVYLPTGYSGRILWAYTQGGTAVYSGESKVIPSGLTKIEHPVYNQFMLHINKIDATAMTPADLLTTGAKILGHISGSLLQDLRPESVSGEYAIINSSLIAETNNFGLATTQLRFLAGGLYNTNMYTLTNRQDYKPYGTFHNVERLEYTKYLGDSWRTHVNRDKCVSGYDCPLLRVDDDTYNATMIDTGDLIIRRCIVPKGVFRNDAINGNTYEDIDFSYANEDLMINIPGYTNFLSSHREGLYRLDLSGGFTNGLVSHKGNLDSSGKLFPESKSIPLDGNIIEQGTYYGEYVFYENAKHDDATRVRMKTPLPTRGSVFPSLPSGFGVRAILYLDENFVCKLPVTEPTKLETTYPYYVACFRKDNLDSKITASEFIALNASLTMLYYTKVPEITGSAYVGAGCTVRGDVQLHGDPYVNRVFDINVWERGTTQDGDLPNYPTWSDRKIPTGAGNRFRFVDAFEVEPGGTFSCAEGYLIHLYRFDGSGKWIGQAGWATTQYIPEGETRFAGLIIKKATNISDAGGLITEEDLALANVKYLRAFKKRRYITNELDRKSPEDILLDTDMWEQGYLDRIAGKTYEELKSASSLFIRLRRLINTGKGAVSSHGAGFDNKDVSFDGFTKCVTADDTIVDGTPLYGATVYKVPSAAISVADVVNSRFVVEFVPSPRIIALYDSPTIEINGTKVRMYDNSVLSKTLRVEGKLILKDDAVARYDYGIGECLCGNGHSDALIKLP